VSPTDFAALTPLPRLIELQTGSAPAPRRWRVAAPGGTAACAADLAETLPIHRLVTAGAAADLTLLDEAVDGLPAGLADWQLAEAYALDCRAGQVVIRARGGRGQAFALRTLAQLLLLGGGRLPDLRLRDWPALRFRGTHLTLGSGHQPPLARLYEFLADCARLKLTSVTIEYDDGFRWERYPFIARAGSLSADDVRGLVAFARERHLDLIPLVDSLGHQEHYLRHPQLAHLRELPGRNDELCPSNPAGLAFIKDLWREVLDAHGPGTWANCTGDEVFRMGAFCPACGPADRPQLYGDWYADLSRWLLEQGRRPMLWHDMLVMFPQQLARLPRESALIYWNYWPVDAERWTVGHGLHGALFRDDLARVPAALRAVHERHWLLPDGGFRPWSFLPWLVEQGFTALGASGGSPMESAHPCMGFAGRVNNAKSLARAAAACGAEGLLHTYWASFASALAAWHSAAAAADHSWHPRAESAASALARWGRLRHGDGTGYARFAAACDRAIYAAEPPGFAAPPAPQAALAPLRRAAAALQPRRHGDELAPHRAAFDFQAAQLKRAAAATRRLRPALGDGEDLPLDLRPAAQGTRLAFIPGTDGARLDLPAGRQLSHGVAFDLLPAGAADSVVLASRRNPGGAQRAMIPVGAAGDTLLLMHNVCWLGHGAVAARLHLRWADGATATRELVVGRDTGDWYGAPPTLPAALPAWQGHVHPYSQIAARAWLSWWQLERRDCAIAELVVEAGGGEGHLVLLAATLRRQSAGIPAAAQPGGDAGAAAARRFVRGYRAALAPLCVPEHIPRALAMLGHGATPAAATTRRRTRRRLS
jgi:hypothetical protein